MNNVFFADKALQAVLEKYQFQTVLDIGCGQGLHSNIFREHLKTVIGIDASTHWGVPDILAEFMSYEFSEPFDLVWCSHVLEHQVNVQAFLRKIYATLKPGGILAVTVPPRKPNIVGGHVSIWNAGLLLYNFILAGFDCRNAMILQYDYNISIVVRKSYASLPPLRMDAGDIELLAPYFPHALNAVQDFSGDISEMQWNLERDLCPPASSSLEASSLKIEQFKRLPQAHSDDLDALIWSLFCSELPGGVAEFGISQGQNLCVMAEHQSLRTIHGFDSFVELPGLYDKLSKFQKIHPNVKVHPGDFGESLSVWVDTLNQSLALIHIDVKCYSTTKFLLEKLNAVISPGTVIVFENLCNWQDCAVSAQKEEGEWQALKEWMHDKQRSVRVLAKGKKSSGSIVISR